MPLLPLGVVVQAQRPPPPALRRRRRRAGARPPLTRHEQAGSGAAELRVQPTSTFAASA
jgi:hypothetical protein